MTFPNAACPGLSGKPRDTAIGQLLALYRPGGRQSDNQETTIKQYTQFAGRFDGHCDGAVQYRAHRPIEEVQGFTRSHWMPPVGKHLLQ